MSLYDGLLDLGPTKKEEDDKAKAKELPAHLKRKRLAPTGPPPPSVKKAEAKKTVELVAAPVLPPVALTSSAVDDPYDPAKPNSYEKIRGIREDGKKKQKTKPSIGKDLLLKAGWKDGQRLGKRGSGISRPIDPIRLANGQEKYESLVGSRVLLIKNAAGAGDVDEDLAPDLQAECCKCGNVLEVLIWECSEEELGSVPATEQVRVFVSFDTVDAATRALESMNGRFFGGRQLEVTFFNEESFKEKRLKP